MKEGRRVTEITDINLLENWFLIIFQFTQQSSVCDIRIEKVNGVKQILWILLLLINSLHGYMASFYVSQRILHPTTDVILNMYFFFINNGYNKQ